MCERVSVTLQDQPPESAKPSYCHCANCSTQAGSTGSYILLVNDEDLKIEGGNVMDYLDRKTTSGTLMHRKFCGD